MLGMGEKNLIGYFDVMMTSSKAWEKNTFFAKTTLFEAQITP